MRIALLIIIALMQWITAGNTFSQRLMPGRIVDTLRCIDDPGQSYALYLPSGFRDYAVSPIIYFFEPSARGKLPLWLYSKLADAYGFIMVCSNNSHNGPLELMNKAAEAVLSDTRKRLLLDTTRFYIAGFSGASRFSSYLADRKPIFRGVIGCGAGFIPEHKPMAGNKFWYCGIVGNQDMNYAELIRNHQYLNNQGIVNRLFLCAGGHDWPPPETMGQAFAWQKELEMEQCVIPPDSGYSSYHFLIRCDSLLKFVREKEYLKVQLEIEFLKKLNPEKKAFIDSLVNATIKPGRLEKELKLAMQNLALDEEIEDTILQALKNAEATQFNIRKDFKSRAWWKQQKKEFDRLARSANPEKHNQGMRLLNFVEINTYEMASGYMERRDYIRAIMFLDIYLIFSPQSLWANYTLAKAYAYEDNHQKCLKQVQLVLSYGFKKKELLKQEPFTRYASDEEFKKILEDF